MPWSDESVPLDLEDFAPDLDTDVLSKAPEDTLAEMISKNRMRDSGYFPSYMYEDSDTEDDSTEWYDTEWSMKPLAGGRSLSWRLAS